MNAQAIAAAIAAAIELINLALKAAQDLKQSGELDAVGEAALDAKISALTSQSWWKPEAPAQGNGDIVS